MRIETLDEFVVLAKHLNFTAASRELYISQPSLSSHIGSLEKELGFSLLVRNGNRLYLTQAGTVFLSYAQHTLRILREGLRESEAVATELPPVSIPSLPAHSPYYQALMRLRGHPFVFVDVNAETSPFTALEKGLIDIGIHFDYRDFPAIRGKAESLRLAWMLAGMDRMSIAVMKTHPLALKQKIRRSDMVGLKVSITSGAYFDAWKLLVQKTLGDDLEMEFDLCQLRSMRNLAFMDMGDRAHICSSDVVHAYFSARDDVVIFDTIDEQEISYPEIFVYRKSNEQAASLLRALTKLL